ncbi:MAG: carbohydrate kinase family protein [Candidatus Aminicenantaceae bacterium]
MADNEYGKKLGLIGTITYDVITSDSGSSYEGIGGVLYQAAVLCGLGKHVSLYTNLGGELVSDFRKTVEKWSNFSWRGIQHVPGPGNRVYLHYPERGERIEVLKSVVPPLNPDQLVEDLPQQRMLILIINSGFDIELTDWRSIASTASCPMWIDIHSLPLARKLDAPREYTFLKEWREWAEGVDYLQANRKEVASMLGHPERLPLDPELNSFGIMAFNIGVKMVFITLGKEGGLVMTPKVSRRIAPPRVKNLVDTTGCGDVFCAATVAKLVDGADAFEAASFGLNLATKAVSLKGVEETYALATKER